MGLAVCAIFVVKGGVHDCPGNIFCHLNLTQGKTGHLFAPINPEHQNSSDKGHRFIKSDHMWLGYQQFLAAYQYKRSNLNVLPGPLQRAGCV